MNRKLTTGALCTFAAVLHGGAAGAAQCIVDFGPPDLAALTYNEQCISFVQDTDPYLEHSICDGSRWAWVQGVSSPGYGHLHLAWDDPLINCFASDGCFGRQSGGSCQIVNHNNTTRYVSSHTGDQWIWVSLRNNIGAPAVATFSSIWVRGSVPVDVWFKRNDNTWWVYNNLAPGNWAINQPNTIEVRVHQDGGPSWSFDHVVFTY